MRVTSVLLVLLLCSASTAFANNKRWWLVEHDSECNEYPGAPIGSPASAYELMESNGMKPKIEELAEAEAVMVSWEYGGEGGGLLYFSNYDKCEIFIQWQKNRAEQHKRELDPYR